MSRPVTRTVIPVVALLALIVGTPSSAFAMYPSSGGSTKAQTTTQTDAFAGELAVDPFISLQEAQTIQVDTQTQVSNAVIQGIINKLNAAARSGVNLGGS